MKFLLPVLPSGNLQSDFSNTPNTELRVEHLVSRAGNDVIFNDMRMCNPDKCVEKILNTLSGVDCVLFSSNSCNIGLVLKCARAIQKSKQGVKVMLGGRHATAIKNKPEFYEDCIDVYVHGFLWSVTDVIRVENALYYDRKHVNLPNLIPYCIDDIIMPLDFDLLGENAVCKKGAGGWLLKENKTLRMQNMMFGVGCKYNCIFCDNPFNKMNNADPVKIMSEINRRREKYKINALKIDDDDPLQDEQWTEKFIYCLNYYQIEDLSFLMSTRCFTKNVDVKIKQMQKLEKCGLKVLGIGIEFPSDKVLRTVKKGIKVEHIKNTINLLNKHTDIKILCYSIFGLPETDEESVKEAMNFVKWAKDKVTYMSMTSCTPLINTELYDNHKQYGAKINFDVKEYNNYYFVGDFDKVKLKYNYLDYQKYMDLKVKMYSCLKENGFLRKETENDIVQAGHKI